MRASPAAFRGRSRMGVKAFASKKRSALASQPSLPHDRVAVGSGETSAVK